MTTFQVPERMNFSAVAPKILKAVLALDSAARQGLDPVLVELVQIRASQLNRCAYCIDYHSTDAREAGETEERIYQLSAWQEAGVYTLRERAALALTEHVTLLPGGVPDEVYDRAAEHFDEAELARLIAVIFTVNTWNRMNVTTRKTPGTP
ncbi:alkylhydroperoxidase AhpD family core domain-containing protein [Prauserella marina]|uniref:Alkylhydroperoxidase AhpD family core domain-containing protein n=1 Tax=Prauserella marina TaxID=530584 RepID=A0A1G6IPH0_9PSEU|nr:carboxymuconolactone decarboxylase family protein [Prauserella marina]PWV84955.1 AhpD family alkylhydroperoxidase [Prauserella marina]SDC08384.1 alkylhydroperoxidase AhpD family core domain-containing protein [Prauserella marina]